MTRLDAEQLEDVSALYVSKNEQFSTANLTLPLDTCWSFRSDSNYTTRAASRATRCHALCLPYDTASKVLVVVRRPQPLQALHHLP